MSRRPNQTFEKRVRGPAAACLISSRVIGRKSPASVPIDFEALGFRAGARGSSFSPPLRKSSDGAATLSPGISGASECEAWASRGAGADRWLGGMEGPLPGGGRSRPRIHRINRSRKRIVPICLGAPGERRRLPAEMIRETRGREEADRPDFEATTKVVHRGPADGSWPGNARWLSQGHEPSAGPKEQRPWGSNLQGKLRRGGTPQHAGLGTRPASSRMTNFRYRWAIVNPKLIPEPHQIEAGSCREKRIVTRPRKARRALDTCMKAFSPMV